MERTTARDYVDGFISNHDARDLIADYPNGLSVRDIVDMDTDQTYRAEDEEEIGQCIIVDAGIDRLEIIDPNNYDTKYSI